MCMFGGEQGGYMCVHVNGGQRSASNVNPWALSAMISEKGSLISPELTSLSRLAGQQTPESSDLLSLQRRDCKRVVTCGFVHGC